MIVQHLLGVTTLFSKIKKNKVHVSLAYFLTNFARVIAYFGWAFGHYHDKENMANYTLIAAVVLFIISSASFFFGVGKPGKSAMDGAKKVK